MDIKGTLEINSIQELIRIRQVIASAQGNIGLFWMNRDLTDVIPVEMDTVQHMVEDKVTLPQFLSTQKTHAQAWQELPYDERVNAGGDIKNHKSIPRGFVAFDIKKNEFVIVGGDWLNDGVASQIAEAFGLSGAKYTLFKNPDYNAQPTETETATLSESQQVDAA